MCVSIYMCAIYVEEEREREKSSCIALCMKCWFVDCLRADHPMENADFCDGERGMQPVESLDPCSASQGRLLQRASMDNSRGSSKSLISNNSDNVGYQDTAARLKMRSCSTLPSPSRTAQITPASPFHQQLWSSPDYWRSPSYSSAQAITVSESGTSIASDDANLHRTLNTSQLISNSNCDALSTSSSPVQALLMDSNMEFSSREVIIPTLIKKLL